MNQSQKSKKSVTHKMKSESRDDLGLLKTCQTALVQVNGIKVRS